MKHPPQTAASTSNSQSSKSGQTLVRLESNQDRDAALSQECLELVDFIKDRKLISPALVLLELYRPLVGLGDAMIIFSQPFLKFFSPQQKIFEILRDRSKVDWLIKNLDGIQSDEAQQRSRVSKGT